MEQRLTADRFVRFSLLMVRWRWYVLAVWVAIIVVSGGILGPKAADVVKGGGFAVPGSTSDKAAAILANDFHISTRNTVVVVYRSTSLPATATSFRNEVLAASQRIAKVKGVTGVTTYYGTHDPTLLSRDGKTTTSVVSLRGDPSTVAKLVPDVRKQLRGLSIQHFVTGRPASDEDTFTTSEQDLKRSELFTIPIVVILLILVFRTLIASIIPLILGACAVTASEALTYVLGSNVDTSVFALNIASMIGLGLGIDFSLLLVSRLREERAKGQTSNDAISTTMATAGRSIMYSAVTLMLSMVVMTILVIHLMIVRSITIAVIFVSITSLLAALTLMPALFAILGHRIEWLRVVPRRSTAEEGAPGFWYRLSKRVMARPWIWLGVSLAILFVIAFPVRDLRLVGASPHVLPTSVETVKGYDAMKAAFGEGRLTPIQIVMSTTPDGVWTPTFLNSLEQLTERLRRDPRTDQVESLFSVARLSGVPVSQFKDLRPQAFTTKAQRSLVNRFVNLSGNSSKAIIIVFTKYGQYDPKHEQFVYDLKDKIIPNSPQLAPYSVFVGGEAAEFLDFTDSLYGRFPYIVISIMILIFIVLMMFFQSIFLPIKAMLMNLATVLATYGALVVVFQYGFPTQIFGFQSEHLLGAMTPAILYAILFGLSTDYEVFLLSRVRENYHRLRDNDEAVAVGLQSTAGIITAAGLILIGTFGSFASAAVVSVKEIGIGLAVGILLDTTVVRIIMVPATMKLMGDWNWWMPDWLKRIVPEIREGPIAGPAETRAETA
jgi:RND superfamily putative drug exporter